MPNYRRPKPPRVLCEGCRYVWVTGGKRCTGCRVRASRGHDVAGSECLACGLKAPRLLRRQRFTDTEAVLCANHAALVGRRTLTVEAFLEEVLPPPGDRRATLERRGQLERRYPAERRQYPEPVEIDERRLDRRAEKRSA